MTLFILNRTFLRSMVTTVAAMGLLCSSTGHADEFSFADAKIVGNGNTANCPVPGTCIDETGASLTVEENLAASCQRKYGAFACNYCPNVTALKCNQEEEGGAVPTEDKGGGGKGPTGRGTGTAGTGNGSGSGGTGNGSGSGGQSSQDCQQAAQRAASACSSQGGSGYGSSGSGINSYASSLSGATANAARANIQQGVACTNEINNCVNSCKSSDPGLANQCSSLSHRVQQMGQQAQSLGGDQQQAANSGAQSAASNNPGADNCQSNPNSPECRALAEAKKYAQGDVGFDGKDQLPENFNVPSATDGGTQANNAFPGSGVGLDQIRNNVTYGTIANNSGGQIPGSGGAAGAAGSGGRRSPGAPGYTTDVLQGFQGASGTGGGANVGSTQVDASGGFKGYGSQARGPANQGFDLKRYLPGGSKQPNTRNLGGFIPFSIEINGPHVNIWNRISDRFMEKCKLGELIDCR